MQLFIKFLKVFKLNFLFKPRRFFFTLQVRLQAKSCGKHLKVNAFSVVNSNTILGTNVNFNGLIINGHGKVSIGDNFHCGRDCLLITDVHNYDKGESIPYDSTYISKPVIIGDNVWLGSRVIILGGVTIEEGSIIQAGSVVINKIHKYEIAGGNPAKAFKKRDIEHYEKLKAEKRFH